MKTFFLLLCIASAAALAAPDGGTDAGHPDAGVAPLTQSVAPQKPTVIEVGCRFRHSDGGAVELEPWICPAGFAPTSPTIDYGLRAFKQECLCSPMVTAPL